MDLAAAAQPVALLISSFMDEIRGFGLMQRQHSYSASYQDLDDRKGCRNAAPENVSEQCEGGGDAGRPREPPARSSPRD